MICFFFCCAIILTFGFGAFAQSPEDHQRISNNFRASLEKTTKEEFEVKSQFLFQQAKQRNPEGISTETRRDATNGIKMLVYNRAYIYYSCMIANRNVPAVNAERSVSNCVKDPLEEAIAGFNMSMALLPQIASNRKIANCILKARLFKAEAEFPPYDFLVGEGVGLYDFKSMRNCFNSRLD